MPLHARIQLEVIEDDEREDLGTFDLADPDDYYKLVLGLGNGLFRELRAVGETKLGILTFANLLGRGGFRRGRPEDAASCQLYRDGDIVYPDSKPFAFLSPLAANGETVDFENLAIEIESAVQAVKSNPP